MTDITNRTSNKLHGALALLALLLAPGAFAGAGGGVSEPAVAAGTAQGVPEVHFTVSAFEITGENPLSDEASQAALAPFLGEHQGLDGLLAAADALQAAMGKAGFAFHRVVLPAQTLADGKVRLQVVTFAIGEVAVQGNQHFSEANIRAAFPTLGSGPPPNARELGRNIMIANRHPAKSHNVTLRASDKPNTVDAVIRVQDRPTRELFSIFNNIGTKATGRTRLTFGVQDNNLWDKDHGGAITYTTSPEHKGDVDQWGFHYRLPKYDWGGEFTLYYTDSDVDSGTVAGVFDVTGAGKFLGLRYDQALLRKGPLQQWLSIGIEDRRFINNINFLGTPIGTDVASRPVTLSYRVQWRHPLVALDGHADLVQNLSFGRDNNPNAYRGNRLGADDKWHVFRYGVSASAPLPRGWLLRGFLSGQLSDEPLIAGEQFGLGGASTVRGYDEREVSGDSGHRLSAELWAPAQRFGIRPYLFTDYGYKRDENAPPGGSLDESLSSLGVGGLWQWSQRIYVTLQWGHTLQRTAASASGRDKVHFSIYARY